MVAFDGNEKLQSWPELADDVASLLFGITVRESVFGNVKLLIEIFYQDNWRNFEKSNTSFGKILADHGCFIPKFYSNEHILLKKIHSDCFNL